MSAANSLTGGNVNYQQTGNVSERHKCPHPGPLYERKFLYGAYIRDSTYRTGCTDNGDSPLKMARTK